MIHFFAAYWPWLGLAAVLFVLPLAYIGIEVAGAVLVGADGITPVRKTDHADEAHAICPDCIATAPEPIQATYSLADWEHNDGRPTVWDSTVPPGGLVCAVGAGPGRICGMPVESEPCPDHGGTS